MPLQLLRYLLILLVLSPAITTDGLRYKTAAPDCPLGMEKANSATMPLHHRLSFAKQWVEAWVGAEITPAGLHLDLPAFPSLSAAAAAAVLGHSPSLSLLMSFQI